MRKWTTGFRDRKHLAPVLDTITTQPLYAWSMRRLKASATGAYLTVRPSANGSNGNNVGIGFTATGDLDELALLAAIGSNSAAVQNWISQISGVTMTQATLNNQPLIATAGAVNLVGGRPALLGNPTGAHWMQASALGYAGNILVIAGVGSMNAGSGTDTRLVSATSGTNFDGSAAARANVLGRGSGNTVSNQRNNVLIQTAVTPSQPFSFVSIWNGVNQQLVIDGVYSATTASTGAFNFNLLKIFQNISSGSYWDGSIQELLVFNIVPTAAELETIRASQKDYFNLVAPSP